MNLWVKRLGLLLVVTLVLFACEEENTIGLPPEDELGIFFAEIPLRDAISQVWVDDIVAERSNRLISGQHEDPELGTITSTAYADLNPTAGRNLIDPRDEDVTYEFSSASMSLRILDAFGDIENNPEVVFSLYQLADTVNGNITYDNSDFIDLGEKIGESAFTYYNDSLGLEFSTSLGLDSALFDGDNTYLYTADFELDQSFFQQIFERYRDALLDTATYDNIDLSRVFNDITKGIAVVAEAGNTSLMFDGNDVRSRIQIDYRENDGSRDTTRTFFMITNRSKAFNQVSPNRNQGWTLEKFSPLTSFYTPVVLDDPNAYIQSGANLFMAIDFAPFRNFADTATNATIQRAELFINSGPELRDRRFDTPPGLNFNITSDERLAEGELSGTEDSRGFLGEMPIRGRTFDGDSVNFTNVPTYLNQLILDRTPWDKIVIKGAIDSDISRIVIPKDSIFLRVFYSKAN